MAAEDEDLVIEVDDPPAEDLNGVEVHAEDSGDKTPKVIEPEEGLEILKGKLEAAEAGRVAAEGAQRAAEADAQRQAERAVEAQTGVQESNVQLVTNALEMVKQTADVLEGQYAEAQQAQDFAAAAKIQTAMAKNAAKELQLENGLEALKNQPKPRIERQPIIDPVENFASQLSGQGYANSANWIRRHPEYVQDPRLERRMIAAANLAETDGLRVDSPEYIAAIEQTLGLGQRMETARTDDDALSEASHVTQRRESPPPPAPVNRSGNGTGGKPNVVRLTADEREAAENSGLTPEEYAREKLKIARTEGRVN